MCQGCLLTFFKDQMPYNGHCSGSKTLVEPFLPISYISLILVDHIFVAANTVDEWTLMCQY